MHVSYHLLCPLTPQVFKNETVVTHTTTPPAEAVTTKTVDAFVAVTDDNSPVVLPKGLAVPSLVNTAMVQVASLPSEAASELFAVITAPGVIPEEVIQVEAGEAEVLAPSQPATLVSAIDEVADGDDVPPKAVDPAVTYPSPEIGEVRIALLPSDIETPEVLETPPAYKEKYIVFVLGGPGSGKGTQVGSAVFELAGCICFLLSLTTYTFCVGKVPLDLGQASAVQRVTLPSCQWLLQQAVFCMSGT